MSDVKLKTSQNVLDALQSEEASAEAKLNADLEDNLGNEERRQLCEKMQEQMVGSEFFTFKIDHIVMN